MAQFTISVALQKPSVLIAIKADKINKLCSVVQHPAGAAAKQRKNFVLENVVVTSGFDKRRSVTNEQRLHSRSQGTAEFLHELACQDVHRIFYRWKCHHFHVVIYICCFLSCFRLATSKSFYALKL